MRRARCRRARHALMRWRQSAFIALYLRRPLFDARCLLPRCPLRCHAIIRCSCHADARFHSSMIFHYRRFSSFTILAFIAFSLSFFDELADDFSSLSQPLAYATLMPAIIFAAPLIFLLADFRHAAALFAAD